jgi:putative transposase
MNFVLQPWHLLVVILAGLVNRRQQEVIDYLRAENKILKEACGKKRIRLTDGQRRLLAIKGKLLGRKLLGDVATIVTPDTILRWHRHLVSMKWDYSRLRKNVGRPPVPREIVELVLRIARENRGWGYDRIQGALANLGHEISDTTVGNILEEHGLEPAPARKRRTSWKEFVKAHWEVLGAVDFTTVEVWTKGGLVTLYLLFVMELRTRRVYFAGCTTNPDTAWMKQVARNLTDCNDGFLLGSRYVLMDRDAKFCDAFRRILEQAGVETVRLPTRSPNLNAFIERFMRTLKSECLDRMIVRRTIAPRGCSSVPGPLPFREESSGLGEPPDRPRGQCRWTGRRHPVPRADRWPSEVLLPRSSVSPTRL